MYQNFGPILTSFFLLLPLQAYSLDKIKLNENGQFVDSRGYVKLFHGFNNVVKSPPYYDTQGINRTRMKMFRNWGVNVIRLGVIWTGVYPNGPKINENYLKNIENIIDLAAEYGIYIILDMHQDALSARFGTYDGIPPWVLDLFPKPPRIVRYPWPYRHPPANFFENYLTYECANAAQQLYSNVSSSWIFWGDYWETLASRYGAKTNVLGHELINEPPPGNFFTNPLRALPGFAGKHNLLPVYDYLVDRIRKVDHMTLIFYEPVTYSVFGNHTGIGGTGFDRVPGSLAHKNESSKSVLSYHYYCWVLQTTDPSTPMPLWKKLLCDHLLLPNTMETVRVSTAMTGGGSFLTEFGICGDDGNPHSINTIECNAILKISDEKFASWTYWDGNFLDKSGNPIDTQLRVFSRVYPRSTLGQPIRLSFDPYSGDAVYEFRTPSKLEGHNLLLAELFLPIDVHYKHGVNIKIHPDNFETQRSDNILSIFAPNSAQFGSTNIRIEISRAQLQ